MSGKLRFAAVLLMALMLTASLIYLWVMREASDPAAILEARVKSTIEEALPKVFTVVATGKKAQDSAHGFSHMTGTAFAFDKRGPDLYLITNFHVIEDADSITVISSKNRRIAAQLIGSDPLKDIAVLKVFDIESVQPLKMNRGPYRPGTFVIALGSPFAFMNSASFGIVSAVGRNLGTRFGYEISGVIQVDAPINQGNSGGPLLNLNGEVIGVNTAIFSLSRGFEGIGFAIPAYEAERIARKIIDEGEKVIRLFGISCADFDRSVANSFNLPVDGVLVMCLYEDSVLREAGLRGTRGTPGSPDFLLGDIITAVNGVRVKTIGDIASAVSGKNKAVVEFFREGKTFRVEVDLK
jgi:S1-C subfamily serine protease